MGGTQTLRHPRNRWTLILLGAMVLLAIVTGQPSSSDPSSLPPQPSSSSNQGASLASASSTWIGEGRISIFPVNLPTRCPSPPCECDIDDMNRKRVICKNGGLHFVPMQMMDLETQVIKISGPKERPNNLIIGRIFTQLHHLEEIAITHSNLPAIGDSSFWPGKSLISLDLSYNNISLVRDRDFNGPENLRFLALNDNNLRGFPSAPFQLLPNLTELNLARNKFSKLEPRLFYKLGNLRKLDLSGNPLVEINPEDLKDLHSLQVLVLRGCKLKHLHSLIYQQLSRSLEQLDLGENSLTKLVAREFEQLSKLRVLKLDGNQLTTIAGYTFINLVNLVQLNLSSNTLVSIGACAFCGDYNYATNGAKLQLQLLDLSNNKFHYFPPSILSPISESLITLLVHSNQLLAQPAKSVANLLIGPFRKLRYLTLSDMKLDDQLMGMNPFKNCPELLKLDLAGNLLANVSAPFLTPLRSTLEILDLSRNQLAHLPHDFLSVIKSMGQLRAIYLQDNPWCCFRCHILPLIDWINSRDQPHYNHPYFNVCPSASDQVPFDAADEPAAAGDQPSASPRIAGAGAHLDGVDHRKLSLKYCIQCQTPGNMTGKFLHLTAENELEFCDDPRLQLRLTSTRPNVGLAIAVFICVCLTMVIAVLIVAYQRKKGASYYTREGDQRSKGQSGKTPSTSGSSMVSGSSSGALSSCGCSVSCTAPGCHPSACLQPIVHHRHGLHCCPTKDKIGCPSSSCKKIGCPSCSCPKSRCKGLFGLPSSLIISLNPVNLCRRKKKRKRMDPGMMNEGQILDSDHHGLGPKPKPSNGIPSAKKFATLGGDHRHPSSTVSIYQTHTTNPAYQNRSRSDSPNIYVPSVVKSAGPPKRREFPGQVDDDDFESISYSRGESPPHPPPITLAPPPPMPPPPAPLQPSAASAPPSTLALSTRATTGGSSSSMLPPPHMHHHPHHLHHHQHHHHPHSQPHIYPPHHPQAQLWNQGLGYQAAHRHHSLGHHHHHQTLPRNHYSSFNRGSSLGVTGSGDTLAAAGQRPPSTASAAGTGGKQRASLDDNFLYI